MSSLGQRTSVQPKTHYLCYIITPPPNNNWCSKNRQKRQEDKRQIIHINCIWENVPFIVPHNFEELHLMRLLSTKNTFLWLHFKPRKGRGKMVCKANVLNLEHTFRKVDMCIASEDTVCAFCWLLALTLTGVVGGPVFAGHAHHLWVLGLIPLLTPDLTARPHHILVVLSCWCAAGHGAMFHVFNGSTPWCSYDSRKDSFTDLFLLA